MFTMVLHAAADVSIHHHFVTDSAATSTQGLVSCSKSAVLGQAIFREELGEGEGFRRATIAT